MENNKTPSIRFKGFTDPWEQRKVFEIADRFDNLRVPVAANLRIPGNTPYYGANGIQDYVEGYTHDGEYILVAEDGASDLKNYPVNYVNGRIWVNNHAHVLQGKEKIANNKFLSYAMRLADIESVLVGGGRAKLNADIMMNLDIAIPSFNEQEQIGAYFSNLDNLITLHQRKYNKLLNVKKSMLEKMFPKNGSNIPEIRFKGFTDPWEQRKFGDLADYKKGPFGSAITKDTFVPKSEESIKVYEQQNAINKDWELERYFLPKEYALTKLKSFEVHGGDIIVSCAGTIGKIYEIPKNADTGVINQALMRVRVDEDCVDKRMFKIAFSTMIDDFTRAHSNGSAIKNIPPFSDLKPMGVLLPSLQEQEKISSYFENLDNLITLHQRELEKLQNIKKSMLEKMFV